MGAGPPRAGCADRAGATCEAALRAAGRRSRSPWPMGTNRHGRLCPGVRRPCRGRPVPARASGKSWVAAGAAHRLASRASLRPESGGEEEHLSSCCGARALSSGKIVPMVLPMPAGPGPSGQRPVVTALKTVSASERWPVRNPACGNPRVCAALLRAARCCISCWAHPRNSAHWALKEGLQFGGAITLVQ